MTAKLHSDVFGSDIIFRVLLSIYHRLLKVSVGFMLSKLTQYL